jgi:hypothetical protein
LVQGLLNTNNNITSKRKSKSIKVYLHQNTNTLWEHKIHSMVEGGSHPIEDANK